MKKKRNCVSSCCCR